MRNKLIHFQLLLISTFQISELFAQINENKKLQTKSIIELGFGIGDMGYDENFEEKIVLVHHDECLTFNINYTHALVMNNRIWIGLGAGYKTVNILENSTLKTENRNGEIEYVRIKTPGTIYHFIPLFSNARLYFREKPESAYLSANLGSFFKLDQHEGKPRLYWELGLGQRYRLSSTKSITWSLNFNELYLFRKKQGFNELNENPRIALLDLRIGFQL